MSMSSKPRALTTGDSGIYEVSDYVSVEPTSEYVLVRHYRTVHRAGGQITHESVSSTEALVEKMIRVFASQVYEASGTIHGFFPDPDRARYCAEAIFAHHGKHAEVAGTQLSVTF